MNYFRELHSYYLPRFVDSGRRQTSALINLVLPRKHQFLNEYVNSIIFDHLEEDIVDFENKVIGVVDILKYGNPGTYISILSRFVWKHLKKHFTRDANVGGIVYKYVLDVISLVKEYKIDECKYG